MAGEENNEVNQDSLGSALEKTDAGQQEPEPEGAEGEDNESN